MKRINCWCYRSGQIEFGINVPNGGIQIATGDESTVRDVITVRATHARDSETLLVPGIPEAEDDDAAISALCQFIEGLRRYNGPKFRACS